MIPSAGAPHLSDDDLLLHLEGSAGALLPSLAAAHLGSCEECGRRAEWIRRRAGALDARLAELDWMPPEALLPRSFAEVRRRQAARPRVRPAALSGLRRAAVIVAVLLSAALLVQPVRAWVLDWAGARWEEVEGMLGAKRSGGAVAPTPPAPAEPQQTEYRFTPEGSELRLEVASPQPRGTLTVWVTGEPGAVLEVIEPGGEREPVWVLPDGVEIRNSPSGTGSYRLSVPRTVRLVRLRIGDEPSAMLRTSDFRPGEQRIFPLRERR
jgi:hypothetical protein